MADEGWRSSLDEAKGVYVLDLDFGSKHHPHFLLRSLKQLHIGFEAKKR